MTEELTALRPEELTALAQAAQDLATLAHAHDKRDDGQPYLAHVAAVAAGVGPNPYAVPVAWLHDVVEDHPGYLPEIRAWFPSWVVQAVLALSRRDRESYVYYLSRVAGNPLAKQVKMADLKHNLEGHKPGNRRDKYELALALLERS
jgi:(p)ppGpp synthase/HD superfamily hydrolase